MTSGIWKRLEEWKTNPKAGKQMENNRTQLGDEWEARFQGSQSHAGKWKQMGRDMKKIDANGRQLGDKGLKWNTHNKVGKLEDKWQARFTKMENKWKKLRHQTWGEKSVSARDLGDKWDLKRPGEKYKIQGSHYQNPAEKNWVTNNSETNGQWGAPTGSQDSNANPARTLQKWPSDPQTVGRIQKFGSWQCR